MRSREKNKKPAIIGLIGLSFLMSSACSSSSNNGGRPAAGGGPAVLIVAAEAVQKDVPIQIKAIGEAEAYSTVAVKAQVTGEITAVYFQEGQDVKQGDLLFTIDPQPYDIALKQAQALLEKDTAQLKEAEADAQRYKDLVAKEYVTREQNDKILSNRDVFAAAIKADEANVANARLQLERCTVRSPIDGRTGSFLIYRGNLIRATDASPALVINQIAPIRVSFSVPEQDLPRISDYRTKGELKTEAIVGVGAPVAGALTFIDNAIDRTTGTIMLKGTFANQDRRLWPGQFVNVVLTLTTEKNAVVVPSQAVQTGQSGLYLFVVKDDMTVEMRRPKVDRIVGGEAVITDGVKPGEKVVTDGQLQLVPGARVQLKQTR
jgi:membrane fusion protein, multidrug efflux system